MTPFEKKKSVVDFSEMKSDFDGSKRYLKDGMIVAEDTDFKKHPHSMTLSIQQCTYLHRKALFAKKEEIEMESIHLLLIATRRLCIGIHFDVQFVSVQQFRWLRMFSRDCNPNIKEQKRVQFLWPTVGFNTLQRHGI